MVFLCSTDLRGFTARNPLAIGMAVGHRISRFAVLPRALRDFPWVDDADKANYLGVLVTPILRPYLHTLIPFVVYTATMPGSGKTILTCGPGMLYGQRVLTWTHSDAPSWCDSPGHAPARGAHGLHHPEP